eukprot:UN24563
MRLPIENTQSDSEDGGESDTQKIIKKQSSKYEPVYGCIYLIVSFNKRKLYITNSMSKMQSGMLKIFCTTFNCGNAKPPANLQDWFDLSTKPGLIVVGFQECEWKGGDDCEQTWIDTLDTYFKDEYILIANESMVEIRIFAYCKSSLKKDISRVCMDTEATGIGHVYGNKGGVAISFDFRGTSMCFVNSHLAAHQEHKQRRDEDYSEIVEQMRLGILKQELLAEFHYVFWMGDLNYRVDYACQGNKKTPEEKDFNMMVDLIKDEKKRKMVFGDDQLQKSIKAGDAFTGFTEGEIKFKPTFKVEKDQLLTL